MDGLGIGGKAVCGELEPPTGRLVKFLDKDSGVFRSPSA
jgi:hypothetical protein